jgi:hypothetical protein
MNTAKKIGFAAFIITEIIFGIIMIIGCIQILRDKAKFEDLITIAISQTGVLTVVWGAQGLVNYGKTKTITKPGE